MAKNYNIQTWSKRFDAAAAASSVQTIGSVVPAGMTRYVTFIRVNPLEPGNDLGSRLFLCSGTVADASTPAAASTAKKLLVRIASSPVVGDKNVSIPASPDTEHPLFTVAAGAYLIAHLPSTVLCSGSVQVFVQYYDE
jgi:hypothetical protein